MTGADPTFALALAVVLAAVYLLVLRAVDANEKEPVWALGVLLLAGALAGALLPLVAGGDEAALGRPEGALVVEPARFAAIALGLVAVEAISRLRGWSELNGLLDGLLYGAAAGLGVATGEAFVRELSTPAAIEALTGGLGPLDTLWRSALAGPGPRSPRARARWPTWCSARPATSRSRRPPSSRSRP